MIFLPAPRLITPPLLFTIINDRSRIRSKNEGSRDRQRGCGCATLLAIDRPRSIVPRHDRYRSKFRFLTEPRRRSFIENATAVKEEEESSFIRPAAPVSRRKRILNITINHGGIFPGSHTHELLHVPPIARCRDATKGRESPRRPDNNQDKEKERESSNFRSGSLRNEYTRMSIKNVSKRSGAGKEER